MSAPTAEQVVLLDEQGRAVGAAPKREVHHRDTPLHLAFSCYLFDEAGRVLLTRRALHKATWPGVWTNSCCGHPAPGEPFLDAVRRRVGEELGVLPADARVALPAFRYRAVMDDGTVENEMCPVVVAHCADPGALSPDPEEVADTAWLEWAQLRADVRDGRRELSPWCTQQVELLPEDPFALVSRHEDLPPAARG